MTDAALRILALAWYLSAIMAGEAGVMSLEARREVGQTVLNRIEAGWWGDAQSVADAYHMGQPTDDDWELAWSMAQWGRGDSEGLMFVYGGQDMRRLGLPPADVTYREGHWELHLYYQWPGWGER